MLAKLECLANIWKIVLSLKLPKAADVDNVTSRILKELLMDIAQTLTIILNRKHIRWSWVFSIGLKKKML